MEREDIIKNINYMKEVVESSNRYTNLSGLAAIICGLLALAGCGLTYYFGWYPKESDSLLAPLDNTAKAGIIWLTVFLLAVAIQIIFTVRKAKKMEILPWTKLSRQIIFALIPSLLAGALITFYLFREGQSELIPGFWILLYGVGVSSAGMFSVMAVRILGWAFILTSWIPIFIYPGYGIIFLGITFGIYHIIYGAVIYVKYKG
jgi:MFS family permease